MQSTAITCMPLTVDGSGGISVMYSPDTRNEFGNYNHGTMATYTCSSGFSLYGPRRRMCVGDGGSTWGSLLGMILLVEVSLIRINLKPCIIDNFSSQKMFLFNVALCISLQQ